MKVTFLGTGTSTGVPQIGCDCPVCRSGDVRDKRLRCSAIVETGGRRLLIDCGPDFREQILRLGSVSLDALLITHSHYDHVGGIDDLRPYSYVKEKGFEVYCQKDVSADLHNRLPYCFSKHPYAGVPSFDMHIINPGKELDIHGIRVLPLKVMHGKLPILGFRIGAFAYITDCSTLPEETFGMLEGVEVLAVNALRIEPHDTHMTLEEALAVIKRVGCKRAYLTHVSHQMGLHAQVSSSLPAGVELAYDGQEILV